MSGLRRTALAALLVLVLAAVVGWIGLDRGWFGNDDSRGWFSYTPLGPWPSPSSPPRSAAPSSHPQHPQRHRHQPPTSHRRQRPLAGKVVVLDPGHQLGNHNFPDKINAPVDAGGLTKPCNTTGTSTDGGYPEATFTWVLAHDVRRILRHDGARVVLTRHSNSQSAWGPCVDVRGRIGNPGQPGPTADVKLSLHADGSYASGAHGFHVIAPAAEAGRTAPIAAPSLALARTVRNRMVAAGFTTATYTAHRGIDVRDDLGTLNWSKVPAALIECGNMRDAGDAAVLTSHRGQHRIARAIAAALERYLTR